MLESNKLYNNYLIHNKIKNIKPNSYYDLVDVGTYQSKSKWPLYGNTENIPKIKNKIIEIFNEENPKKCIIHNSVARIRYEFMYRGFINIFETEDEWFYLELEIFQLDDLYFKLDQMGGVFKFLEDLKKIIDIYDIPNKLR